MRFLVVPIYSDQRTEYGVRDSAGQGGYRGERAEHKATARAAAMNQALLQHQAGAGGAESGNVFFTLFAAVALVGVVGSATVSLVRGPLSTATGLNQQVRTDSRLMVAGRLAALAAAENGTDCDGDGIVEPLPPVMGAECADAVAAGGGCMPGTVGGDKADPWGTPIMYCGFDHGTGTTGCPAGLRAGNADPSGRAALAVISAGANRAFETTCGDDPAYVVRAAGDDRVYVFDESEAAALGGGGGLWSLKSGDPNTVTIDKDVEITTPATFTNTVDFSAGFLLPDSGSMASCLGPDQGALRRFLPSETLQICDGGTWKDVAQAPQGAAGSVQFRSGSGFGGASDFLRTGEGDLLVGLSSSPFDGNSAVDLHIAGGVAAQAYVAADGLGLSFGGATTALGGSAVANEFYVTNNGARALFLDAADNLRIGAGAPAVRLDVDGTLKLGDGGEACDDVAHEGAIAFSGGEYWVCADHVAGWTWINYGGQSFLDLWDAPPGFSYAGRSGWLVGVNGAEDGLEFVSAGMLGGGGASAFTDLSDVPGDYSGYGGEVVMVRGDETGLRFNRLGFLDLEDVTANYSGVAGHVVTVNATEDGLEFVSAGTLVTPGASAFTDLSDVPGNYTGQAGEVVKVRSDETGLRFDKLDFVELENVPSSFAGQGLCGHFYINTR